GESYGFSPFVLDGPGFPAPVAMLFGVAIAVLIGLLIAAPAIRIRGLQLAVVTLAGAVAANELIMANEPLIGKGARSNLSVPPPNWFGIDVTVDPSVSRDRSTLIIFCSIWLLIVVLGVIGIRRGTTGRNFLAVRSNERAAAACGVDVSGTKLLGFGIGSAVAGIAGVLTAYQQTILQISSWDALAGITNVTLLFLGGVAHLGGALIGAAITPGGILSTTSSEGQILRNAAAGAIMIAVAIFRPDGLVSLLTILREQISKSVNFAKKSLSHIISTSSGGNNI
ncbi:MAG: branched-chain amino acid ABC transporter permease, partial [Actinomycetota bacterium]|nr:branched-chain amino acid ABC transporter permease [Actinomycetota bacterium]